MASWRGVAPPRAIQGRRRSQQGNLHRRGSLRACRRGSSPSSSFRLCSTSAAPSTRRCQSPWPAPSTGHLLPTIVDWLASSRRPSFDGMDSSPTSSIPSSSGRCRVIVAGSPPFYWQRPRNSYSLGARRTPSSIWPSSRFAAIPARGASTG